MVVQLAAVCALAVVGTIKTAMRREAEKRDESGDKDIFIPEVAGTRVLWIRFTLVGCRDKGVSMIFDSSASFALVAAR